MADTDVPGDALFAVVVAQESMVQPCPFCRRPSQPPAPGDRSWDDLCEPHRRATASRFGRPPYDDPYRGG